MKVFGSYFGETVRRTLGGFWYFDEEDGIVLTDIGNKSVAISPHGRAHNRLFKGKEDSFVVLYEALPIAIDEADPLPDTAQQGAAANP